MMNTQTYSKNDFAKMDSMHDSIATQVSVEDKTLIVIYNHLDEGVIGNDGVPFYKNPKLTIEYAIASYCDAKLFNGNSYQLIDLLEEKNEFYKLTNNCSFVSYKYAVDSFQEITLFFDVRRKKECWSLEISMDAEKVTYHWE